MEVDSLPRVCCSDQSETDTFACPSMKLPMSDDHSASDVITDTSSVMQQYEEAADCVDTVVDCSCEDPAETSGICMSSQTVSDRSECAAEQRTSRSNGCQNTADTLQATHCEQTTVDSAGELATNIANDFEQVSTDDVLTDLTPLETFDLNELELELSQLNSRSHDNPTSEISSDASVSVPVVILETPEIGTLSNAELSALPVDVSLMSASDAEKEKCVPAPATNVGFAVAYPEQLDCSEAQSSLINDMLEEAAKDLPETPAVNTQVAYVDISVTELRDASNSSHTGSENASLADCSVSVEVTDVSYNASFDSLSRFDLNEAKNAEEELRKKGNRVRFHEERVVTGYLDPPTPWKESHLCSTLELVSAYQDSCRKMGVKPLQKLLSQLQNITAFEERNDLLMLRGENIDGRVCETLEEVFRRVQFKTVDIEATSLDEETAVTMFDLLDYYESCQRLNVSYNKNLGVRGWQACARYVKKAGCLETLEARGCTLNDPAVTMMGRSLRLGSYIKTLHLENCLLSGRSLMLLVAAIKFNVILKDLFLADNKLTPSDGVQLGSLLKANRVLSLLDLRNNLLQDVGVAHISDGLCEQNSTSGLNTLVLWNNQITFEAMTSVSRALAGTRSLETLNLGHNNITNEGIHRLKEGLLQNKSLLRIGLQSSMISCEGAVALAEFIAESPQLVRLDLRGNMIRTGGLMALMLALKVNQSVVRVDLDPDPKKEAGVRDYAEQQRRLLCEIATFTARNLAMMASASDPASPSTVGPAAVAEPAIASDAVMDPPASPDTAEPTPLENVEGPGLHPMLTIPRIVNRTDLLESPAYVPSDTVGLLTTVSQPVDSPPGSVPSSRSDLIITSPTVSAITSQSAARPTDLQLPMSSALAATVSPADLRHAVEAIPVTSVTATPDRSSASDTQAPAAAEKPAGKTNRFAATVRRKFTVSKAVLPSAPKASQPPVVVFTKSVADPGQSDLGSADDDEAQVRILGQKSPPTPESSPAPTFKDTLSGSVQTGRNGDSDSAKRMLPVSVVSAEVPSSPENGVTVADSVLSELITTSAAVGKACVVSPMGVDGLVSSLPDKVGVPVGDENVVSSTQSEPRASDDTAISSDNAIQNNVELSIESGAVCTNSLDVTAVIEPTEPSATSCSSGSTVVTENEKAIVNSDGDILSAVTVVCGAMTCCDTAENGLGDTSNCVKASASNTFSERVERDSEFKSGPEIYDSVIADHVTELLSDDVTSAVVCSQVSGEMTDLCDVGCSAIDNTTVLDLLCPNGGCDGHEDLCKASSCGGGDVVTMPGNSVNASWPSGDMSQSPVLSVRGSPPEIVGFELGQACGGDGVTKCASMQDAV